MPLAILILTGCGGREAYAGWRHHPPSGGYEARVVYDDDAREIGFVGLCDGGPIYILKGGDYGPQSPTFTLTVDDRSWTLPITHHAHGRTLMVDRYEQQIAIAQAKRRIAFEVGSWKEVIMPSPELASFVRDWGA